MNPFKQELNALYAKHKKEIKDAVTNYLNIQFTEFFEKNPNLKSVKINASQEYNDSDYSDYIYNDGESIKINGYSYIDLDNEDWDNDEEYIENIGMTREQHENIAESAATIFEAISDDILLHVYGNSFGLKVERSGISLESSDIESY